MGSKRYPKYFNKDKIKEKKILIIKGRNMFPFDTYWKMTRVLGQVGKWTVHVHGKKL